jgi:transcriptional regulator with PAS, ATPase and Fis domain
LRRLGGLKILRRRLVGTGRRSHIERVLADSATLEEAAARLGINVTTLWRRRKRYGID